MKKKQKKGPAKKQKVLRKSTRHVFDVISAMPGIGVRRRHLLLGRANIVGKSARKFIDINKYHLLLRTIKKKIYNRSFIKKKITSNILDLRYKYGSYKGVRMREGLPCNGQRTHSNGCTAAKRGKAIFLESVPIKAKKNKKPLSLRKKGRPTKLKIRKVFKRIILNRSFKKVKKFTIYKKKI